MHPLSAKSLGSGGIRCYFATGSIGTVEVGYIVKQLRTTRFLVSNGTTTAVCDLVQTAEEIAQLPSFLPLNTCALVMTTANSTTEHIRYITSTRCVTIEGHTYAWHFGAATANAVQVITPTLSTTPVSLITSNASCFASTSPSTLNMNLSGAEFLVVAAGWSSASAFNPPRVTVNGEMMTMIASPVEWDTTDGAVAIYTLPLVSPPNSNLPIVFTQLTFDGNMQVAVHAYTGTNQTLGKIVTSEYGTSQASVDTGTTNFTGITSGSLTTIAGFTFFGGTPSAINFSSGWTATHSATASNEGVFAATNPASGNFAVTVTPSPDSYFTMLNMGWEVLRGTPKTSFLGVSLAASSATCLGVVSSGASGTVSFDPTDTANFLVAVVGWASASPLVIPTVRYGDQTMQVLPSPIEIDGTNVGAVALFYLPLEIAEYSGSKTITVSSTAFAGLSSISLAAYTGSSQSLGVVVGAEMGTNSVPVANASSAVNGVSLGSSAAFVACSFFGDVPTAMYRSDGWNDMGNANNGTNQSIYSFHSKYQTGGDLPITLTAAPTDFNFVCIGYEVK